MKDNTQEKNLIEKNEDNNIFIKIKNFFRNIFYKKNDNSIKQTKETVTEETDNNYSFNNFSRKLCEFILYGTKCRKRIRTRFNCSKF